MKRYFLTVALPLLACITIGMSITALIGQCGHYGFLIGGISALAYTIATMISQDRYDHSINKALPIRPTGPHNGDK